MIVILFEIKFFFTEEFQKRIQFVRWFVNSFSIIFDQSYQNTVRNIIFC